MRASVYSRGMGTTTERPKRSTYWLYDKHRSLIAKRKNKKQNGSEWVRKAIELMAVHDEKFKAFICLDCGGNTLEMAEYYMVQDAIWNHVNPKQKGMLCIGDLEKRLGRQLVKSDFTECGLNEDNVNGIDSSKRLRNRMLSV